MEKFFELLTNLLYLALAILGITWVWHMIAPVTNHYMSADEVRIFRDIFFGLLGIEVVRRIFIWTKGGMQ